MELGLRLRLVLALGLDAASGPHGWDRAVWLALLWYGYGYGDECVGVRVCGQWVYVYLGMRVYGYKGMGIDTGMPAKRPIAVRTIGLVACRECNNGG